MKDEQTRSDAEQFDHAVQAFDEEYCRIFQLGDPATTHLDAVRSALAVAIKAYEGEPRDSIDLRYSAKIS